MSPGHLLSASIMSAPAALAAAKLLLPETKMKHEDLEAPAPTGYFIKKNDKKTCLILQTKAQVQLALKIKQIQCNRNLVTTWDLLAFFQKSNFKFTTDIKSIHSLPYIQYSDSF